MKFIVYFAAFIAIGNLSKYTICEIWLIFFKPIVYSQTTVTSTTKRPYFDSHPDEKVANLSMEFSLLSHEAHTIGKSFELQLNNPQPEQLTQILDSIKILKLKFENLNAAIKFEIGNTPQRSFLNRLTFELTRIQADSEQKGLKWIAGEILGFQSGLSKFENYQTSETIAIVEGLVDKKFRDFSEAAIEVDQVLQEHQQKNPLEPIDKATKDLVDKDLKNMVAIFQANKLEIANTYYEEIEKLRLDGKELSLMQRVNIESEIDMLNYGLDFMKKYDELFMRVDFF